MYADTVEIRWFKKGEIPESVREWYFSKNVNRLKQPPRTDYYHSQTAGGKLGTKLREGTIEVKQFKNYAGRWASGNGKLQGRLERWRKWSFKLSQEGEAMPVVYDSDDWIAIEKRRWLRQYAFAGEEIIIAEAGENTNNGCTLELSEILHNKVNWWSLCLEAYGRAEGLVTAVHQMAYNIMPLDLPFALSDDDGASYPEWLEKILRK